MSNSKAHSASLPARCPCKGVTLDKLIQPAILVLLAKERLHGYLIVEGATRIAALQGARPDPTGVYRTLHLMERKGLLTAAWDASARGPARKTYTLTPAGRHCLDSWIDSLTAYRKAIATLLSRARRQAAACPRGCKCMQSP